MITNRAKSRTLAAATVAVLGLMTGCSAGSLGSSDDDGGGGTTITWLTGAEQDDQLQAQAVVDAFEQANPDITVEVEGRPGGGEGDNLVKTRLQTGTMADVFNYNSGSLFQQIAPANNLTPIDASTVETIDEAYHPQVSVGQDVYGVPYGNAFGGGIMYNRRVFEQVGVQVPTTWAELVAAAEKIKAAGIAPVIQTYQDTWTAQLLVLADFHNVAAANPSFAQDYTAGRAKFATDPAARAGFEHLQEIHDKDLANADFASTRVEDGMRLLAEGAGAMYPMLSLNVSTLQVVAPEKVQDVGFFALPGQDAGTNGLTAWYPDGVYIPKSTTGQELQAAQKLAAFIASPPGCEAIATVVTPTGPYLAEGCELPADVPQITEDVSAYFEQERQSAALEFSSPVKGPALEQILVEVGSGIRTAADGAALYDQDVQKQAQQLGLEGW
ncbi:ABC transporter substrate-binding protein [Kineococcus sp. SYSU DK005]|uniref:ABC transporter substrate-binding protein n=1 Tax=Kineococcus sp. SYSU DK005 TaxID=3383126 RepID=UPI003D7D979A